MKSSKRPLLIKASLKYWLVLEELGCSFPLVALGMEEEALFSKGGKAEVGGFESIEVEERDN